MFRSIMQNLDVSKCYICHTVGITEVHHCLHGTANRKLAEKDGLLVNLCPKCHRALHDKGTYDLYLKHVAQFAWQDYNMKTDTEWRARYGKNYL